MKGRYVSRGIWGGATPKQRKTLKRYIKEHDECFTITIRHWLAKVTKPARPFLFQLRVTDAGTNALVFEGSAYALRGAKSMVTREQNRYAKPSHSVIMDLTTSEITTKSYP